MKYSLIFSRFFRCFFNIGLVDITGADIKASASWHRGPWRVGGTLRYTFQQALDHSEPGSQTWGNQIPYIPRHSGSVVLEAGWRDLSFSWDSSFTGARWSRTANTPDYYLAPWSLSSAALQYAFHFRERGVAGRPGAPSAGRALLLGVTIDNVFNTPYQVVQGYPMPGFSAQFSVSFRW